jgi:p-cumate 2,3-dioxygenase subunit alpha
VRWNDISRGLGRSPEEQSNTDEGHLRVFWRRWSEMVEGR